MHLVYMHTYLNDLLQMPHLPNIVLSIINLKSCGSLMSLLLIASPEEQTEYQ